MTTTRWNLLLAFVSVAIALLSLEIGARFAVGSILGPVFQTYLTYDERLGWKLRPNFSGRIESVARDFVFDVKISPEGFRIDKGMTGAAQALPDIVILGDSNAFGFGLNSDETFAAQLAAELRSNGLATEVLNAGVPGYDILQAVLRMEEIQAHPDMLFIFLVHPLNDLVNTANEIDYMAYKPSVYTDENELRVEKARRHLPRVPYQYARDFSELGNYFELETDRPSLLDRLTDVSALVYALRFHALFTVYRTATERVRVTWNEMSSNEFVMHRLEKIRNKPGAFAARVWPEIAEVRDQRERIVGYVGDLFNRAKHHAMKSSARICVVLAPEAYRLTGFFLEQTNLAEALLPDLTFDWGSTVPVLHRELSRRGVPVIVSSPDLSSSFETQFLQLDDHKSARAYRKVIRDMAKCVAPPTAKTRVGDLSRGK